MENKLRHEQDPVDSLGGTISSHREVPKVAGHILLHESPHKGEIKLDTNPSAEASPAASHLGAVAASAEQQPARIEQSAWHTISMDNQGNVLPQEYGQGFHQERLAETAMQKPSDTTATAFGQLPVADAQAQLTPAAPQLSNPMDPNQSTAFGDVEMPKVVPTPKAPIPANPLYSVMPGSRASTPPAVAQAEPAEQQLSHVPTGGPQQTPITMTGAVNPSFAQPALPHDPQLPAGQRADVQHRLPSGNGTIKKVLMSPWLWLAVGVAMIWYFSSGLFN
jgi:hypothetical protein